MYWYKRWLTYIILFTVSGLYACKPDIRETDASLKYFDLKKFIDADTARLNKLRPLVTKTVLHNQDAAQTLQLRIDNWGRELDLFAASDINKPAWRESYAIAQAGDSITYTAKDSKLTTRRMVIYQTGNTVKKIAIHNFARNILYQTTEKLVYYPDSLYLIDKLQQVRFLGDNRYLIRGKIK